MSGLGNPHQYFFAATNSAGDDVPFSGDTQMNNTTQFVFTDDGEWHTLIIDTQACMTGTSKTGKVYDGSTYAATRFRIDFGNGTKDATLNLKGLEFSDNLELLQAKYGVASAE